MADVGRCVRMLKQFPELRIQLDKVITKFPRWTPFIDCWKELEMGYNECFNWNNMSESGKKEMEKIGGKHFRLPNERYWELMQQLMFASRYLGGMRIQNYHGSWKNKPVESF